MKKVYFIGIGGIGISALARYYLSEGWQVFGSDDNDSELIQNLIREGIKINIGRNEQNINKDFSRIIHTIAVTEENIELQKARALERDSGLEVLTYPKALGEMTKERKVIAICGTHGKTTTTAMTYFALKNAGIDVSMIVGSLIEDPKNENLKTNCVHGKSEWLIIEACEYRRSFLNYTPDIILVTNIDNDHLDYFKDQKDINNAFQEFVDKIKKGGTLVLHKKDEEKLNFDSKYIAEDFSNEDEIDLQVPGIHNRKNAQLVIALGTVLKLDKNKILEGLKNFKGTWRRQEYKGNFYGIDFYDDYAHHPTELKATLQAFREKFPLKNIVGLFQPHLYSRTKILFNDFADSFTDSDKVFILPIYAAREKFDGTINSEMLVKKIGDKADNTNNIEEFVEKIKNKQVNILKNADVIITMGAGDIKDIYKYLK